jgi:hypothetical protein
MLLQMPEGALVDLQHPEDSSLATKARWASTIRRAWSVRAAAAISLGSGLGTQTLNRNWDTLRGRRRRNLNRAWAWNVTVPHAHLHAGRTNTLALVLNIGSGPIEPQAQPLPRLGLFVCLSRLFQSLRQNRGLPLH